MSGPATREWERLGGIRPEALLDARVQLHHALQLLTSFAQAYCPPQADDSHRSFGWDSGIRGFRTHPAAADPTLSAGLRLHPLTLRVDRGQATFLEFPLEGVPVHEARGAMAAAVGEGLGRDAAPGDPRATQAGPVNLAPPEFELPDHPVSRGEPLDPDPDHLRELARWFGNAHATLTEFVAGRGVARGTVTRAEPVRLWPHHFDIATLLHTGQGTIGLGLAAGGEGYKGPYWYARSYPGLGACDQLPNLGMGHWHTLGWVGMVLDARAQVGGLGDGEGWSPDRPDDQARRATRFLEEAQGVAETFLADHARP